MEAVDRPTFASIVTRLEAMLTTQWAATSGEQHGRSPAAFDTGAATNSRTGLLSYRHAPRAGPGQRHHGDGHRVGAADRSSYGACVTIPDDDVTEVTPPSHIQFGNSSGLSTSAAYGLGGPADASASDDCDTQPLITRTNSDSEPPSSFGIAAFETDTPAPLRPGPRRDVRGRGSRAQSRWTNSTGSDYNDSDPLLPAQQSSRWTSAADPRATLDNELLDRRFQSEPKKRSRGQGQGGFDG